MLTELGFAKSNSGLVHSEGRAALVSCNVKVQGGDRHHLQVDLLHVSFCDGSPWQKNQGAVGLV